MTFETDGQKNAYSRLSKLSPPIKGKQREAFWPQSLTRLTDAVLCVTVCI